MRTSSMPAWNHRVQGTDEENRDTLKNLQREKSTESVSWEVVSSAVRSDATLELKSSSVLTTQDKNVSSKRDRRPHGMCYSESDAQWEDDLPNFQYVASEGSHITPFAQVTLCLKFDPRMCDKILISFVAFSMSLKSCRCPLSTTIGNDFSASPFPSAVSFIGRRSIHKLMHF